MTSDTVRAFAEAVFEPAFSAGLHAVIVGIRGQRPDAEIRPIRCSSVEEMVAGAEGLAEAKFNLYYPTALIRADQVLPPGSRGTESDAAAILGFHVDLDLKGDAHPDATLPDIPTALRVIDAFDVPPSYVVATGHGVQALWLFKEPLSISSDDDRRRTKLLIRRFVATIAAIARQQGGHHVDGTGDLARVLRMPGTLNRAHRNGESLPAVPARLLHPDGSLDNLRRYNPGDLEPLLVDVSDDEDVDHTLVGAFALNAGAAAPVIAERLQVASDSFRRLWRNDEKAEVHDKTTSGYRYAIIGALVTAGASDQDIADAVCAWYAAHHPSYVKHLHRPALIAHEIAKQRTRMRVGRAPHGRLEAPIRNLPTVPGPCGITLVPSRISRTDTRWSVAFEVHANGVDTGMELKATDTATGLEKASRDLNQILRATRKGAAPASPELAEVDLWLRATLTTRKLTMLDSEFAAYRDSVTPVVASANQPTMFDIAFEFFRDKVGIVFVEPNGDLWSERFARAFTRTDFLHHIDPELRERVRRASDYPRPTANDPTKDIRHLQLTLKSVFVALQNSLPDEVRCESLGAESMAARRFKQDILRLWRTPETWIKQEATKDVPAHVARVSMASRARELLGLARNRPPAWTRVHKGLEAYYRVEDNGKGSPTVLLAMRAEFCSGVIKGAKISAVCTQADLSSLMSRYGLTDAEMTNNRIRENRKRGRLCVLSRELSHELLVEIEFEDEAVGPDDESPDGPPRFDEPHVERTSRRSVAR